MNTNVYDEIAAGWYNYRHWTIFRRELEDLAGRWQGGTLLNLGCAHGPDFLPFKDSFRLYGMDSSVEMLRQAQRYADKFHFSAGLCQADLRWLPFGDDSFDYAVSVAAYHHIETEDGRIQALRELRRVLKPGGEAFITVWNRRQRRFRYFRHQMLVPWKTGDRVVQRYYYLFTYTELERLVRRAGFTLVRSFPEYSYRSPVRYFSRNICILVKKNGRNA